MKWHDIYSKGNMKIINLIPLIFILLMGNKGSGQVKSKTFDVVLKGLISGSVKTISVDEAYRSSSNYIFLDSREIEEYKVSHIANATWVGYKNFSPATLKNITKDKHIIVYCSVGKRSENIGENLQKAGYKNVLNLYGGIFEWVNHSYPVVDMQNKTTKKVHAYNKLWGRFVDKADKVY